MIRIQGAVEKEQPHGCSMSWSLKKMKPFFMKGKGFPMFIPIDLLIKTRNK